LPEPVTQTNLANKLANKLADSTAPATGAADRPSSLSTAAAVDNLPESCPIPLRISSAAEPVAPHTSAGSAHLAPAAAVIASPTHPDRPAPTPTMRTTARPPVPPPAWAQVARASQRTHPIPPPVPPTQDLDGWSMVRSLS
jgi:hypothetical protein